ncbi:YiiX/YebB-like N1pC/P60 family cysteine hydrolase [Microbulbifer yueqingensis]|uniref:Permuted papain-like amidase enzyme, YaeF/YiiX, C92 family n=1 Tax=Microbulbifer yueqingensis TaxID=658219 RepID=A0A1G9A307_9GAMM|nr:YiiX/YebB-like N1pC/P60 family cysteine hydrolase [Microbulbifer yueqingensis]SDK21733.1 Permuted papain-like amidase enzyme, YaeF/YiiX, C92 family [Microbulbifer yueqingensis]
MKRINAEILQPGDIVLTTTTKKDSGLIRKVTRSDISHAMVCVAYGSVIDSTGEGVQARNIQKLFYEDECAIYALRSKAPLSRVQAESIVNYARASTGTRYTKIEAAKSIAPTISEKGSVKQYCSRMVARAYASAGIILVKNPDFCTPNDIKSSKKLIQIDNPWVPVLADELNVAAGICDTTEGMREKTNRLLTAIRALNSNVESLNDIDSLVIQREDLDKLIANAFRSSGYLEHWKEELSRFPWRYDPVLIVQFYHSLTDPEELLDYCRATLRDDENGVFAHWETNAGGYGEMNRAYPRETFRLLSDLYLRLCLNHKRRVKAARVLIQLYGKNDSL